MGSRIALALALAVWLGGAPTGCNPSVQLDDDDVVGSDADGDGYTDLDGDCDDGDPAVHPGADELPYDDVDQDCDGADLTDVDGDGHDAEAVGGDDCDDGDDLIHPGADEVCDDVDHDCDGVPHDDDDGDGVDLCVDCDDGDASVHPGAVEVPYDGVDQDCDGADLDDVDQDGFVGDLATGGDDCDDTDPAVHPGAQELPNHVDDDCDGVADEGTGLFDDDGDGYAESQGDCDDGDPAIHPGALEHCDGVDMDCNGIADDRDADGDGAFDAACGFDDCDDADPAIHPAADEVPYDGVDSDCDGEDDPLPGDYCLGDASVIGVPDEALYSLTAAYDHDDGPLGPGHYLDDAEFEATAGTTVVVAMTAAAPDLDPYLVLLDPLCVAVDEDDDGYGGDGAFLRYTVPADGVYTIVATSAQPAEEGAYTLRTGDAADPGYHCLHDFWTASCGDLGFGFGLSASDATSGPRGADHYYDDVEFEGLAGDEVTLAMESATFDAYLYLLDDACDVLADNDDRDDDSTDAQLTVTLPADGLYTMVFTSKHPLGGVEPAEGGFNWSLDCAP